MFRFASSILHRPLVTTSGRDAVFDVFDQALDDLNALLRRGGALLEHTRRNALDARHRRLLARGAFAAPLRRRLPRCA